ncbi:tryptophan-rich sensory protein [Lampropedia puyangensis]|uniref:Tryptophan-rich sensory protein n=1 Tax=Lampropedia puyangensis TaxID=1330072 RepID=A0A4S8F4I6_9BURK|nr:TspO/MBR family protein [Lampropedia puyangensis]THU01064.1 tryptophan-rich sensory protein [Lampropedia puyangensis]
MTPSTKHQRLGLFAWLGLSLLAATLGAIASVDAAHFYAQLTQPSWAPPARAFGPVWSILYALMGLAAWLVWRVGGLRHAQTALSLFIAQLVLNTVWSWLFFRWHLGAWAMADIALLWLLIAATVAAFWRIRPLAAALLIPYLLWVSFAIALNYSVWQLNPHLLG